MTTVLGRYELVSRLGTGGMAEVWRARALGPEGFAKQVVVKRIATHLSENPEVVELFKTEARLASRLEHPNLIHVFDFGRDGDGALVMVMELVDGASLREVLRAAQQRNEPLDVALVAKVMALVCDGLHAAHELTGDDGAPLNVVHRDVSPDNLLLSKAGAVKVADFGIARIEREVQLTGADTFRGKLGYAAPEQVLGQPVTRHSDIWAVGVTLFELLTNQLPHGADPAALAQATVTQPARRIDSVRPDVPQPLVELIDRCLARDPSHRWPTARALADALEAFVASLRPPIRPAEVAALLEGVDRPTPTPAPTSTPLPFLDSEGFEPAGALGADGRMERFSAIRGRPAPSPPRRTPPPKRDAPFLTPISVPTEPEAIASAALVATAPTARPPRPLRLGLLGAAIVGAIGLAIAAWLGWQPELRAGTLVIDSKPSGAAVVLDGRDVGQTPWAGQNPAAGTRTIILRLNGFAETSLQLDGGVDWSGTVTLKRR